MAEKKDAKETNIKNGKVILVRLIAKLIFSSLPMKPGAITDTNAGINNCANKTKINKLKNNRLNTSLAKLLDLFFDLLISDA